MSSSYSVDKQILKRLNTDKTLDSRGKNLIRLLYFISIENFKGVECLATHFGKYTCFNHKGVVELIMLLYRRVSWIKFYISVLMILLQLLQIVIVYKNGNYLVDIKIIVYLIMLNCMINHLTTFGQMSLL